MARKIDVKMNSRDAAQYLKSGTVKAMLYGRASRAATTAGPGYRADSYTGKRARAQVAAVSYQARRDNSRNQTLLRVLGGQK